MKNAGKACNNRLYRHIRTFEKIVKNYFVIYITYNSEPFIFPSYGLPHHVIHRILYRAHADKTDPLDLL